MTSRSEDLLIPATPELLEGWCGPVVRRTWFPVDRRPIGGVLVGSDESENPRGPWLVAPVGHWEDFAGTDMEHMAMSLRTEELHLDLSRAEVRDRVARVLAEKDEHYGPMCTAPDWTRTTKWRLGPGGHGYAPNGGHWTLWTGKVYRRHDVADLDPHDDTRLPDGSRRVDALALAAVWRAVVGEVSRG